MVFILIADRVTTTPTNHAAYRAIVLAPHCRNSHVIIAMIIPKSTIFCTLGGVEKEKKLAACVPIESAIQMKADAG